MKIIVRPKYERSRAFKYIPQAMRFAEEARTRQGAKVGPVKVFVAPHGTSFFGYYVGCCWAVGTPVTGTPITCRWHWAAPV